MRRSYKLRRWQWLLPLVGSAVFLCPLCLGQQALGQQDLGQQPGGSVTTPDAPQPAAGETKSFFARWADFYRQDWRPASPSTVSSSTPARRGLPSPLDSPPFPDSDWSYGGSPVIGEPDGNSYPLMTAINGAKREQSPHGIAVSLWQTRWCVCAS